MTPIIDDRRRLRYRDGVLPVLIQGGMGIGVSQWRLASAVSSAGQLGVVSGTALDTLLVRRLQDGDLGGQLRRALSAFPFQAAVDEVWPFFCPGGRSDGQAYARLEMWSERSSARLLRLTVIANFIEVFLAKDGHGGAVGINLLEKIQLPNLASLYGAMLAGVDYVLMGAGIPRDIPHTLDRLALHLPATLRMHWPPGLAQPPALHFDPSQLFGTPLAPLKRPRFLAIVGSSTLAKRLAKSGGVDGFIVETHVAGGHNAPPRKRAPQAGEPVYGAQDRVDVEEMRGLGLPFWLAGGYGHPEKLRAAFAEGAAGVQVGTPFAFCEESGLDADLRRRVLESVVERKTHVYTDVRASPTGLPFKMVQLDGTISDPAIYAGRDRICDLGYLRSAYLKSNGRLGFRCPGEPTEMYVAKGGERSDTEGRKCLCNGLLAAVGLGQRRSQDKNEAAMLTAGFDLPSLERYVREGRTSYSAADVIEYILGTS